MSIYLVLVIDIALRYTYTIILLVCISFYNTLRINEMYYEYIFSVVIYSGVYSIKITTSTPSVSYSCSIKLRFQYTEHYELEINLIIGAIKRF
jgi:hypothetical protein